MKGMFPLLFRSTKSFKGNFSNRRNCKEYHPQRTGSDTAEFHLVSLHRDFNHRDWFKPESYANDVIDTQQLKHFFNKFLDKTKNTGYIYHKDRY